MNMRRIECILLCLFIGILSMAAQTRTVTGSVFDKADNQPVIGATIAVMSAQGTVAHGTTTDLDGKFKLEVPSGTQNLTCRFMGYTTTTIHLQTGKDNYTTRVRDNILKSKEQKNIQPTKGGHKMVTCQNYVSLFYRQITSCPSDGGIS